MRRVFVLSSSKKPLMPCHPARARELLSKGRAAVYRWVPFTLILKDREDGEMQPVELKVDPGSKTTGISLVALFKSGRKVIWAGNLNHRGQQILNGLLARRQLRCGRRSRHCRYRAARFDNRTKPEGWLPPSLVSRVDNVRLWARKLIRFSPIGELHVETVRFDTQKLENPEVSGMQYQQGTLLGYEVREYLLEKWGRCCAYCGKENVPLEIEHIVSRGKGGTDRISNLALACTPCNTKKGNRDIREFLAPDPRRLVQIIAQARAPLKDAAAVNATRYAIGNALKAFGLPVAFWSGGRTKMNRVNQRYPKDHWIDAACVGETGVNVAIEPSMTPLTITAQGRGSRQMCQVDRYGFPRTRPKLVKRVMGFQTGDMVRLVQPNGKHAGVHAGRVAVRERGDFDIQTRRQGKRLKITAPHHRFGLIQRDDGYSYVA